MLSCQKHLFSLPEGLHYLNCASRAPLLKSSEEAGMRGLRRQIAPIAPSPDEYFAESEALRSSIAALINTTADRIAVTPAVSYGVAIAVHNMRLVPEQNVLVVEEEFPSDVYGWVERCREDGAELRTVPRPQSSSRAGSEWNARLLDAIDERTAVVNVSSVHWTDGIRFDLQAIGARAREVGALFVVDGTQSVGAAPFDFERVRPDLLVCAGYKWLLGPYQIGFAAVGERLLHARPFEHHWSNREGSADTTRTGLNERYREGARRFDVGEHANYITVPMLTAGVDQARAWGADAIQEYCAGLMAGIYAELDPARYLLPAESERVAHILGIRLTEESRLEDIMRRLAEKGVRVSRRGSSIRVSPHVYNEQSDVDALVSVLNAA